MRRNVSAACVGARRSGRADVLRGARWQQREEETEAHARDLLRPLAAFVEDGKAHDMEVDAYRPHLLDFE